MRRRTAIGAAFRRDIDEGRRMLLAAVATCSGNLARSAHSLDVGRRHLYKLIWREELWGEVNELRSRARERRRNPSWLARTRAALRRGRRHGVQTG